MAKKIEQFQAPKFADKVNGAHSGLLVPAKQTTFGEKAVSFKAFSGEKKAVSVIVEIEHK